MSPPIVRLTPPGWAYLTGVYLASLPTKVSGTATFHFIVSFNVDDVHSSPARLGLLCSNVWRVRPPRAVRGWPGRPPPVRGVQVFSQCIQLEYGAPPPTLLCLLTPCGPFQPKGDAQATSAGAAVTHAVGRIQPAVSSGGECLYLVQGIPSCSEPAVLTVCSALAGLGRRSGARARAGRCAGGGVRQARYAESGRPDAVSFRVPKGGKLLLPPMIRM